MQKSKEAEPQGRDTFDISEANIHPWKNNWNSIICCKTTTKYFLGCKKGKYSQVDQAVLCFVSEMCSKGLSITHQTLQLKVGEIAMIFGISKTKFEAIRAWCDLFMQAAGLSLWHQTAFNPKLPAAIRQKGGLEHSFKKGWITSSLDTQNPVWENADIGDCDLKSDSEEYEVRVKSFPIWFTHSLIFTR
jgi:hypothetical protein